MCPTRHNERLGYVVMTRTLGGKGEICLTCILAEEMSYSGEESRDWLCSLVDSQCHSFSFFFSPPPCRRSHPRELAPQGSLNLERETKLQPTPASRLLPRLPDAVTSSRAGRQMNSHTMTPRLRFCGRRPTAWSQVRLSEPEWSLVTHSLTRRPIIAAKSCPSTRK